MTDRTMSGPSDYLAAERTFLAWIRTGLALMGFGFVAARFGLFLQALQISQSNPGPRPYGTSFWFGTALIVLGVFVNIGSLRSHVRLCPRVEARGIRLRPPSKLAIALAVVGLAMAIYLISVREPRQTNSGKLEDKQMTSNPESGIMTQRSNHTVDQTVQKLEETLQAKGVKLFTVIDHSGEAEKAGLHMRPTKLLIFGNPKAGTPLMVASPTVAIDLPLKILVWEESNGEVQISYNSPAYLQARHNFPQELVQNIAVVEALAGLAAK
jgi:uncharacterized protein (DUF302 family)/uncharacterized membrane protein YidH (DUF202 family)